MCQSLYWRKVVKEIAIGKPDKVITTQWDLFLIRISTSSRVIQRGDLN